MSTTAGDLIRDALIVLGIYPPGDSITDADMQQGFTTLNDMLDSWSNESLTCFAILQQSAPLIVGQSAYTIGSGGNFNMTRPIRLIDGPGAAFVLDANGNKYALNVVPRDKWDQISNTTGLITSNFPDTLFYDPQFPLGILNFYPTPNMGYTAYWDSYLQLVDFAALTTVVTLPPGYNLALKRNLAVELKPYFEGAQLDPDLAKSAAIAKGNIKRSNLRPVEAQYEPEITARAQGTYNIYTDGYGR